MKFFSIFLPVVRLFTGLGKLGRGSLYWVESYIEREAEGYILLAVSYIALLIWAYFFLAKLRLGLMVSTGEGSWTYRVVCI